MVLGKEHFCVIPRLQIVPTHPGHIFDDDGGYLSCLNIRHQPFPVRALEAAAGEAVVGVVLAVSKAMLLRIALQHGLLIYNRIGLTLLIVIPGETFI